MVTYIKHLDTFMCLTLRSFAFKVYRINYSPYTTNTIKNNRIKQKKYNLPQLNSFFLDMAVLLCFRSCLATSR